MKKILIFVLSSTMCLFAYSANVPTVNNHGFPQNTKVTAKEVVIEQVSSPQTEQTETSVKCKNVQKNKMLKNSAPSVEVSNISENEKSSVNEVKPLSKKEMKKSAKEAKKAAKNGSDALSIVAFVFAFLMPIVGLILGYVAKGQDGSNIYNKLAIIFGWIFTGIILLYWLGYVIIISSLLA
ncbi:MAG: DUF4190 domain-containing protein [Bacteroidales bacterium]|nr:DUF4190 domain-containing protein [Bacteroidales bacterium]